MTGRLAKFFGGMFVGLVVLTCVFLWAYGAILCVNVLGADLDTSWRELTSMAFAYVTLYGMIVSGFVTAALMTQPRRSSQNLREISDAVKKAKRELH